MIDQANAVDWLFFYILRALEICSGPLSAKTVHDQFGSIVEDT